MTQDKNLTLLKIALAIFAIVSIVYGIGMVFFTTGLVEMSGTDPFEPNWIRWAGGILIALGIAAILAFRNPAKQDIYVIAIGLGTLFTGLALLYSWIFEMQPGYVVSFTVLPCVLNLLMSVLLWWGRQQAKDILKQD
jgi:cytochrome c biogenesis protein CcdA